MTSAKALHSHTSGMTVKQELLQMLGPGGIGAVFITTAWRSVEGCVVCFEEFVRG